MLDESESSMATPFENLRALNYYSYISTDNHDPSIFASLPGIVGHALPSSYLKFLTEFPNTGMFELDNGAYVKGIEKLSGNHDSLYGLGMLFAGCSDKRYDLLQRAAKRPYYEGAFPGYMLEIGDNSGGDAFCLDLRPEKLGTVYYWDHENSSNEKKGLYLITHDFESFVNGLRAG